MTKTNKEGKVNEETGRMNEEYRKTDEIKD